MPYKVVEQNGEYCVYKHDADGNPVGKAHGCHPSRSEANSQMRALYAAEDKELGVVKSANMADWLESRIHQGFTVLADDLFGSGCLTREERIGLSSLIGDSLDVFHQGLQQETFSALKKRAPWAEAETGEDNKEVEALSLIERLKGLFTKKSLPDDKSKSDNTFMVWKEASGYRWLTAYSNKFRDDDNPPEILSDAAHKEFVEAVDKGEWTYPELWIWHVKGSRSGAADYVAYDGSFALASGTFDADKQDVAEKLSRRDDLLTSHGMPTAEIQRDEKDQSILTRYRTQEISVLPDFAAANKHTPFTIVKEVDMALPKQKRAFLAEILGEERTAEIEAQLDAKGKELEQKVEFKEEKKEETPAIEPVVEPVVKYATEDAVVDAIAGSLKPVLEQLESLRLSVENFGKELKQLEITEDEKIKNLITETPAASLFHRVQSAIGAKETEIDGRSSLAKSGPKETFSDKEGPSSVPIINEYLSRRQ